MGNNGDKRCHWYILWFSDHCSGCVLATCIQGYKIFCAWSTADNKDEKQNRGTICWELWNNYVKQCEQRWRLIGWGNNSFSNFQQFQSYLMKLCFKPRLDNLKFLWNHISYSLLSKRKGKGGGKREGERGGGGGGGLGDERKTGERRDLPSSPVSLFHFSLLHPLPFPFRFALASQAILANGLQLFQCSPRHHENSN